MVDDDESVTEWIHSMKTGDEEAIRKLWERLFGQLVHQARRRLNGSPRQAADEEDVAISAFNSFVRRAADFPKLENRNDLRKLLISILFNKASLARRKANKRSSTFSFSDADQNANGIISGTDLIDAQQEVEHLLNILGDQDLRSIALQRLDGQQNKEIAAAMGVSLATIERRLKMIRQIWSDRCGHSRSS